eukprot:3217761-Prymnesium_polylepis.1
MRWLLGVVWHEELDKCARAGTPQRRMLQEPVPSSHWPCAASAGRGLERNRLSGTVPHDVVSLQNLVNCHLFNNKFSVCDGRSGTYADWRCLLCYTWA